MFWIIHILLCASFVSAYEIPQVTFEAFSPKGWTISLPDDSFSTYSFHGEINETRLDFEYGNWARDIMMKVTPGRWTHNYKDIQLQIGDTVHYSICVMKDGQEYRDDDKEWNVTSVTELEQTPDISSWVKVSLEERLNNTKIEDLISKIELPTGRTHSLLYYLLMIPFLLAMGALRCVAYYLRYKDRNNANKSCGIYFI